MPGYGLQGQAPRLKGCTFGRKGRQTGSNQIGIHKHRAPRLVRQKLAGKGGFSSPIGARNDDDLGPDHITPRVDRVDSQATCKHGLQVWQMVCRKAADVYMSCTFPAQHTALRCHPGHRLLHHEPMGHAWAAVFANPLAAVFFHPEIFHGSHAAPALGRLAARMLSCPGRQCNAPATSALFSFRCRAETHEIPAGFQGSGSSGRSMPSMG